MKVIYNSIIPFKGYKAMLTLFILWVRTEYKDKMDKYDLNHEKIHSYQQLEIWLLASIISALILFLTPLPWWWMLFAPVIPILIYILCWLIEIALPPYDKAYKNICFETEAYYNEHDLNYLGKKRKFFTFRFLKYISNKKYPALTSSQRRELRKKYKQQ